jgi:multiple sugar transport system substrate-binding protein
MGSFHVYVNLGLFKKAGVTPPTPTQDWTFSDLFEAAKKIHTAQGDNVEVWGFGTNLNRDIWPNLNGVYLFDEKLTKCLADDPAVVESFQFAQDLMNKHRVALRPGSVKIGNNELFLSGKLGIMLDGTWQVGYLRDKKPNIEWDVATLPRGPRASTVIVPNFTAGWVLPKGVEDLDASWETMKFYASKVFAEDVMFVALSSLPTRTSALESGKFAQWPKNPPQGLTPAFYKKMLDQGGAFRHLKFDLGSKIIASLNKTSLIFSGERPAPDVLKEIASEVNAELPNRPWMKS